MKALLRSAAPCLLVVALAGCARCAGGTNAKTAEELLPPRAPLSSSTGKLGSVAVHASTLLQRASRLPGGEALPELERQLVAQLGFDPLTREGLLSAGLDPDRGAAFTAALPDGAQGRPSWLVALPLLKPDLFATTLDRVLRERARLPLRTEAPCGGAKCVVFASEGGAASVGYAVVRGYGLVARSKDPAADLGAAAQRERDHSLAVDSPYTPARKLLDAQGAAPGSDVVLFAPAGSALGLRLAGRALPGNGAVGLTFGERSLRVLVQADLSALEEQAVAALLPGGGEELLKLLPAAAPLKVRLGISPAQLGPQLSRLPFLSEVLPALRAQVRARGVDLDADLFGSLQPGLAASLATSPRLDLAAAMDFGFLQWRSKSPFDFVQLVAVAQVEKRDRLLLALDAVAQALPRFGATATRSGDDWQVTYAGGAGARFGVRPVGGKQLAYVLGGGLTPDQLVASNAGLPTALTDKGGAAIDLDLGKLAAALDGLPETAYGGGPQAFLARSLVEQALPVLRALHGSLRLAPAAGGLQADALLTLAPDAPAKAP